MIIYQISYQHKDYGCLLKWAGSRLKANSIIAQIKRDEVARTQAEYKKAVDRYGDCVPPAKLRAFDFESFSIYKFEIERSKRGVLEFLNLHFLTDNG